MSLGAGALARPLVLADAASLHVPWLMMIAALALVVALAAPGGRLDRPQGVLLLVLYPLFVGTVVLLQ
jgi:Ca2+/Na+ antiporter